MRTSRPGNFGFSLFELIVVLVLIGVAAAVIMPSFTGGLKGLELETAARDMVTRMKKARSEAISTQRVFRILLHDKPPGTETGDYYVVANEFEETIEQVPFPDGVSLIFENDGFSGDQSVRKVSFYPNGRSSGGFFALRNEQGKTVGINVDPITGFARVQKSKAES